MSETLLAIDPSSSALGYAFMTDAMTLIDAGVVRPTRRADPPITRIGDMLREFQVLVDEHKPTAIVIEMPGKHYRKGTPTIGLMTYGVACGAVWREALDWTRGNVRLVKSTEWSTVSKETRQRVVDATFAGYDASADRGGDCSDAIALGQWYFEHAERKEAS